MNSQARQTVEPTFDRFTRKHLQDTKTPSLRQKMFFTKRLGFCVSPDLMY
ncbi:Uncharacterised protein [Legionella pneumophila subsp. pascullei]|uniref:Uncharacterized protein n=1 Tax=Legionella pneumophila subsp. pascullei TaxID=91890 RepID=A0AAX2IU63_LEGPN|nr:Uncharacterised protein [Legionella pneumophila subsp. pascullei]VEH03898.1 Uncharacterised protein [Legionella pneumophila subsp. pascullei]